MRMSARWLRFTFASTSCVALAFVAGCGQGDVPPSGNSPVAPTAAEVKALVDVSYQRPALHTLVAAPPLPSDGGRVRAHVLVWTRKYDGVELGSEARSELAASGDHWDTHWMRELAEPEPVRRDAVLSFDRAARAAGLDDKLARGVAHARLVYRPELELLKKVPDPKNATDVEMVIKRYRLAVELVDDEGKRTTWVDAYSGEHIDEVSHWHTTLVSAPTVKYGSVPIDTTRYLINNGAIYPTYYYTFKDPIRTSLLDLTGLPVDGQGLVTGPRLYVTQPINYRRVTMTTPSYDNDIAYGIKQSWDYYQATFGRRGLRDQRPSVSAAYNDAIVYYNNDSSILTNLAMDYTTGFIEVDTQGLSVWQDWTTADVIGHEWTHAVFDDDTGLGVEYWGANGGIDEANSDLFGEMIEARARMLAGQQADDDIRDGWVYAQDANDPTRSTKRYMCNPKLSPGGTMRDVYTTDIDDPDPDHRVDAHDAMGPVERAFCLLGRGMLPDNSTTSFPELQSPRAPKGFPALGAKTVAKLQYQALVFLAGHQPYASFVDERNAMLSAATALYGEYSEPYKAIQDAFHVVWVGDAADRTPPVVTLTSGLTLNQSLPITASVTSATPIKSVTFQLDATVLGTVTAAPWQLRPAVQPEGQHTLTITAVDIHLNQTTVSYAVVFDGTGPKATITDVTPCNPDIQFCADYQHSRLYRVDATDYSGVVSLTLLVDGAGAGSATTAPHVFTVNYTAGGVHSLQVRAIDTLGNVSSSKQNSFNIDMTGPTYSSGPTWVPDYSNNHGTVEGRIWFNLCASDPAGVHPYFGVELDGVWQSVLPTATTAGCWTLRLDNVALGTHSYRVHAYDNWGNDTIAPGNFKLDPIPPTLATPIVSVDTVNLGRITVPTSYSATHGIAQVTLRVCDPATLSCIDKGTFHPVTAADQIAHTFVVTGLTPGKTYYVQVEVDGNNLLATKKSSSNFTIGTPPVVYNEVERNDDQANWPPSNTSQIKGTYNGTTLQGFQGYWDFDGFEFDVPAGKSLYVTSSFNCANVQLGIQAWDAVGQEWINEDDNLANGAVYLVATAFPSSTAPSTHLMVYVNFDYGQYGWASPTTPGCGSPSYTLNTSMH